MNGIRLDKRGRRIVLYADVPLPGLKSAIPGAYNTADGNWTVPLNLESLKLLIDKYGRRLKPTDELRRWSAGVRQSREMMATLAASDDAELDVLPVVAPRLARAMGARTYQRVGVRFVADNHATLVADEPGLGKTLIALGGILEAQVPGPYLIIAPKTASRSVWQREIKRWLPPQHRAVVLPELRYSRERTLRRTQFDEHTWLIVHPEVVMVQSWLTCNRMVEKEVKVRNKRTGKRKVKIKKVKCDVHSKWRGHQKRLLEECGHIKTNKTTKIEVPNYPRLFEIDWGAIVIDESHESLIRRGGVPTQRRNGMDQLRLRGDGIRIAMSGTPMNNKPHQLWGTLNWLDNRTYSAFNRWAELFWQKGGYTGYDIGEFRQEREPLLWDSLKAICIRRTKLEVAKDLPPKTYVGSPLVPGDEDSPIGVWLDMEPKQERAYKQMEKISAAELDSGRLEAVTALAELTRLKQFALSYGDIRSKKLADGSYKHKFVPVLPSNKFNWLVENLEEWGYPSNPLSKVVVVSFYTGLLELFAEGLEKHFKTKPNRPMCTAITGRITSAERERVREQFNADGGPSVMMLNVKAGGTAITIDSADRMVFLSETRIPDQQLQAEDRIHRVSNPRSCMYYYLRSLGTIDVGTAIVNQELTMDAHRLLDQRRGIDYVRRVMELSKA